jgi:hypothetical protein
MLFVSVGNGVYIQEHLNRIWDGGAGVQVAFPVLPER